VTDFRLLSVASPVEVSADALAFMIADPEAVLVETPRGVEAGVAIADSVVPLGWPTGLPEDAPIEATIVSRLWQTDAVADGDDPCGGVDWSTAVLVAESEPMVFVADGIAEVNPYVTVPGVAACVSYSVTWTLTDPYGTYTIEEPAGNPSQTLSLEVAPAVAAGGQLTDGPGLVWVIVGLVGLVIIGVAVRAWGWGRRKPHPSSPTCS
jgi:hypothetical protein